MALTARQQLFIVEYLKDRNATAAAERAGYSAKTARVQGPRLLLNVAIAEAVKQATGAQLARVEIDADDILRELARVAFLDPRRAYGSDPADPKRKRLLELHEMPEDVARAIGTFEVTSMGSEENGTQFLSKVKPCDKLKALELLGKNKRLFTDKVELSLDLTLEDLIKAAVKRGQ